MMTAPYRPHMQWLADELRDRAIVQLAESLDALRVIDEKYAALPLGAPEADGLLLDRHRAEQYALATARIVVRRHIEANN